MTDKILQIVGDVYVKRSLFKKDAYRLVFKEESVLFSHVNKELRKQEQKQLIEDLKGKSFKERVGEMVHMNRRVYDKYEQLSRNEILSMGTKSFELPYKDLRSVKKRVLLATDGNENPTKVTLTTKSEKLKLSFSDELASSKTYKILKEKTK